MPANLPPEYFEKEAQLRAARSNREKIALLEELLSVVPKHKGTDKLRADLRRRLSKLKESPQKKKSASRQASPFHIDPEGAGQIVLLGPPNTGKSSLLAALSKARPEVADFPFTTWMPMPGMMGYENIKIQLIDLPPLNREYGESEMYDLIRRSDLALVVIDIQAQPLQQIEDSEAMLRERKLVLRSRSRGESPDTPEGQAVPCLVAVNKVDDEQLLEDFQVLQELLQEQWDLVPVSARTGRYLERFKPALFKALDVIRVYSKAPGKQPDFDEPFVLPAGSRVEDLAAKLHKDFLTKLKSARVWGESVFDGQMAGRDHVLHDGDVVELRT